MKKSHQKLFNASSKRTPFIQRPSGSLHHICNFQKQALPRIKLGYSRLQQYGLFTYVLWDPVYRALLALDVISRGARVRDATSCASKRTRYFFFCTSERLRSFNGENTAATPRQVRPRSSHTLQ